MKLNHIVQNLFLVISVSSSLVCKNVKAQTEFLKMFTPEEISAINKVYCAGILQPPQNIEAGIRVLCAEIEAKENYNRRPYIPSYNESSSYSDDSLYRDTRNYIRERREEIKETQEMLDDSKNESFNYLDAE